MDMTTHTATEPRIIERAPQPYVGTSRSVTMETIAEIADQLPTLIQALAGAGVEVTGPPFLKYDVFHRSGRLDMEAGVPVPAGFEPAKLTALPAGVRSAELPGGRFASITHRGHPALLHETTADLLDWGAARGLVWDATRTEKTESWGLRLELYKTDPRIEPDLNAWETEIVFRLAEQR
jgi:predicted transcriptional regulator YdeE